MTNHTLERFNRVPGTMLKERLHIKGFNSSDAMYKFLSHGDNGLHWKESSRGLKPGIYAFAGGKYHNVKTLDISVLAHI